jgi:hypothetical protein
MNATKTRSGRSAALRWEQILDACADGVADGLRTHLPRAVGIVLSAAAICVSLLLAHIVLGVPMAVSGVGAGTGPLIYTLTRALGFPSERDAQR